MFELLVLFVVGVTFLTSVLAWANTKIILEDLAEIKAALNITSEGASLDFSKKE